MASPDQPFIFSSSSNSVRVAGERWRFCIQSLSECAEACTACEEACAQASRESPDAGLASALRLARACAENCHMTADLLERTGSDGVPSRVQLEACAAACGMFAAECERHASRVAQCHMCAEMCRLAEMLCEEILAFQH
jgi:hypothetical protein